MRVPPPPKKKEPARVLCIALCSSRRSRSPVARAALLVGLDAVRGIRSLATHAPHRNDGNAAACGRERAVAATGRGGGWSPDLGTRRAPSQFGGCVGWQTLTTAGDVFSGRLPHGAQHALVGLAEAIAHNALEPEVTLLLDGLVAAQVAVRVTCLEALAVGRYAPSAAARYHRRAGPAEHSHVRTPVVSRAWGSGEQYVPPTPASEALHTIRLWTACYDEEERAAALAKQLWADSGSVLPSTYLTALEGLLGMSGLGVRPAWRPARRTLEVLPDAWAVGARSRARLQCTSLRQCGATQAARSSPAWLPSPPPFRQRHRHCSGSSAIKCVRARAGCRLERVVACRMS